MSNQQYLIKHHNTWVVSVDVPKRLRKTAGQSRLRKSLQTSSLNEANRLKLPVVAEFKRQLENLAKFVEDPTAALMRDAADNKAALLAADTVDRSEDDDDRQAFSDREELLDLIKSQASELKELRGAEVAARFFKASTGDGTFIRDHYVTFSNEVQGAEQTKSQHRSAVQRYLKWAGEYTTVQETDRLKAGEYVTELLSTSGLARKTIKRHLSSLSQLWEWLGSKGLVEKDVNPWLRHKLGKKSKKATRGSLSDEQLLKLLRGTYSTARYAQVLSDLICIALLGGPRLDEMCAMETKNVHKRADGYWLTIADGKSDAAVRDVPLHHLATPIIERRLKDKDKYLFKGLLPGGPDDKRMWYVSKAYGRYRAMKGVEVKERWQDFHALRHTFMTMIEGAEVPESTVKLLVGHARESMTFGLYSKGQRVKLRDAIEKTDYGPEVMKAIETAAKAVKEASYQRRTRAEMASASSKAA
jgi:integrase